ncbi:MAG: hypothetical protein R3C49_11970 [Planctomycetaceae bacterium]
MIDNEPLAYFITWTVYGSLLQGDDRGWRKRGKGNSHRSRCLLNGIVSV